MPIELIVVRRTTSYPHRTHFYQYRAPLDLLHTIVDCDGYIARSDKREGSVRFRKERNEDARLLLKELQISVALMTWRVPFLTSVGVFLEM